MKHALIMILTNKHFGKIEKTLQTNTTICMALNCVGLTLSSVIQIIVIIVSFCLRLYFRR